MINICLPVPNQVTGASRDPEEWILIIHSLFKMMLMKCEGLTMSFVVLFSYWDWIFPEPDRLFSWNKAWLWGWIHGYFQYPRFQQSNLHPTAIIYHAHHGSGRVWVNFVSQTCSGGGLMLELDAELHVNMSKKTQEQSTNLEKKLKVDHVKKLGKKVQDQFSWILHPGIYWW